MNEKIRFNGCLLFARPLHSQLGKILIVVLAISAAGCSKERYPRNPAIVPVAGVVTLDGEPVQYMKVTLVKPELIADFKARKMRVVDGPNGVTNEKGEFAITTTHLNDGIMPGEYKAIFHWLPPGVPEDLFQDGIPAPADLKRFSPKVVPVHQKYSPGGDGIIDVKVEAGKPQKDLKFELTSKK